jgi:hypothetical protein
MKRAMGLLLAVALTAGIAISIFLEPSVSTTSASAAATASVYVKKDGKKYHGQECRLLQRVPASEIIAMSLADADAAGYEPCRNPKCFPDHR